MSEAWPPDRTNNPPPLPQDRKPSAVRLSFWFKPLNIHDLKSHSASGVFRNRRRKRSSKRLSYVPATPTLLSMAKVRVWDGQAIDHLTPWRGDDGQWPVRDRNARGVLMNKIKPLVVSFTIETLGFRPGQTSRIVCGKMANEEWGRTNGEVAEIWKFVSSWHVQIYH